MRWRLPTLLPERLDQTCWPMPLPRGDFEWVEDRVRTLDEMISDMVKSLPAWRTP